jgi:methylmalonyl-CoA mutase
MTVNLELARQGVEVLYLGYHRSVGDVVRGAIQEDVRAIGLSSYNGGHVEFFSAVCSRLRRLGAGDIGLFGGGGGTITQSDARLMKRRGVDEIFFAGTPLNEITSFVGRKYGQQRKPVSRRNVRGDLTDLSLARLLTSVESGVHLSHFTLRPSALSPRPSSLTPRVVGITGPGGAGKTTLIDELVFRFLAAHPRGRLAILSHDPSARGGGALLGDRAAMVYAHDDRVFMRSLATRGHARGIASATRACLQVLKQAGFDLIVVETAGIGQEDVPFSRGLVDREVLVMSPDYGGRLQLQKIAMLDSAHLVVVNKSDLRGARTAAAEIQARLDLNAQGQRLISTIAKQHRDPGVDRLFQEVMA